MYVHASWGHWIFPSITINYIIVLWRSNRKIRRVGTLKRFGGFKYFRHPNQTPVRPTVCQKETKEPLRADYRIRRSLLYNDVDDLMPESRALKNNNSNIIIWLQKKRTDFLPSTIVHAVDDNRLIVSTRLTVRSRCDSVGTDNNFKRIEDSCLYCITFMCRRNKKSVLVLVINQFRDFFHDQIYTGGFLLSFYHEFLFLFFWRQIS